MSSGRLKRLRVARVLIAAFTAIAAACLGFSGAAQAAAPPDPNTVGATEISHIELNGVLGTELTVSSGQDVKIKANWEDKNTGCTGCNDNVATAFAGNATAGCIEEGGNVSGTPRGSGEVDLGPAPTKPGTYNVVAQFEETFGCGERWNASESTGYQVIATVTVVACGTNKTGTAIFTAAGGQQCYEVPAGASEVLVKAVGGQGGNSEGFPGGFGAEVSAQLPVTSGHTLYVEVGANGCQRCKGAFGGGGAAVGFTFPPSGSGGGASDVRGLPLAEGEASLTSRLLVAGGGGGRGGGSFSGAATGGSADANALGAGGAGGNGTSLPEAEGGEGGKGATSTQGGEGGKGGKGIINGQSGHAGVLGVGGSGGGGGGGGVYGGGGGGEGGQIGLESAGTGGGGAGSSFVAPSGSGVTLANDTTGKPEVTITPLRFTTATTVSCIPSSLVAGGSTKCTATVEDEATSEATTPTGNVAFKTGGSGSFNKASCALAGSGAAASCEVTYTPAASAAQPQRTDKITGEYKGDESLEGSKGATTVMVITPATIPPVISPVIPSVIAPTPPVAPVLSGLAAVHRCVTSAVLEHAHARSGGLAFSFTLSEAANVTFAVLHRVGSPAWTKCPPVRGNTPSTYRSVGEGGPLVPVGRQADSLGTAARARPLATVIRLTPGRHRIGLAQIGLKRLPPGTYVFSAKAVNSAGQSSGVKYAKFWVFSKRG